MCRDISPSFKKQEKIIKKAAHKAAFHKDSQRLIC
jgi:hypothetical protein